MSGAKICATLAMTVTTLGLLATAATAGSDRYDTPRGYVVPCSLAGVNPAYHPEIFGNPADAASYGFFRSPNGTWHVNCSGAAAMARAYQR